MDGMQELTSGLSLVGHQGTSSQHASLTQLYVPWPHEVHILHLIALFVASFPGYLVREHGYTICSLHRVHLTIIFHFHKLHVARVDVSILLLIIDASILLLIIDSQHNY